MNRLILPLLILFLSTQWALADFFKPYAYMVPASQADKDEAPEAPDPSVRETDAGRWVMPIPELMQRTYDVSGAKSEWVLGTSILGSPELDPISIGIGSVSRRYPSMLAGLYTTRLGYDPTALNLNGDNGILFEERRGAPVDTPVVDLDWERSAFNGNALHMLFRRLITDSVTLDLGLNSHSNKDSKDFRYQNVTHSPYFALGRDSSSIPFTGRNIAVNSMHFQPELTWRFGFGRAFFKMNYISLHNADNTNHNVLTDSLDKSIRTFQAPYFTVGLETRTYGTGAEFYPIDGLTLSTDIQYGNHEIKEDSLTILRIPNGQVDSLGKDKLDTLLGDKKRHYNYETILGGFGAKYATLLNPALKFNYEFLNATNYVKEVKKEYFQDREVGYLELSDTLWRFMFRTQVGGQRNSSVLDEQEIRPAFSADVSLFLPFHLRLNVTERHDNKFPDVNQLKFVEGGRLSFANKDLKTEIRDRQSVNLNWYSREVFYGLGFRHEYGENLLKHQWVKGVDEGATLADAFRWTNIRESESFDWMFQLGFRLGNWKFYLERGQELHRENPLRDTPGLYYKGSIHWQNRFVFDRLGVSVRWDWQWFDNRYVCTINETNRPELIRMKNYLALDFEARMQILSFELYTRIENFNHSMMMPDAGYTPEGLRFSYGIVWSFGN